MEMDSQEVGWPRSCVRPELLRDWPVLQRVPWQVWRVPRLLAVAKCKCSFGSLALPSQQPGPWVFSRDSRCGAGGGLWSLVSGLFLEAGSGEDGAPLSSQKMAARTAKFAAASTLVFLYGLSTP